MIINLNSGGGTFSQVNSGSITWHCARPRQMTLNGGLSLSLYAKNKIPRVFLSPTSHSAAISLFRQERRSFAEIGAQNRPICRTKMHLAVAWFVLHLSRHKYPQYTLALIEKRLIRRAAARRKCLRPSSSLHLWYRIEHIPAVKDNTAHRDKSHLQL